MEENLTIKKSNALLAYNNTDSDGKELLEHLFGSNVFEFDYKTINSYEAACKRNGEEPITDWGDKPKDEIAYIKLKAITKAINNDPEFPRFTTNEWRYWPYFILYTQEEIDEMDEEKRSLVVLRSCGDSAAYGGVACANANYASSYTNSYYGSRLAFIESERARFSGNQHKELWADFVFRT